MQSPTYDILKKEGLALAWVEAIGQSRGEYIVFDQRSRQIVASLGSSTLGG